MKQEKKEKKVENKQLDKPKKVGEPKVKVLIEETKNKKNQRKGLSEKPVDFDEGDWEMVPSKADKKKKSDQSPIKKDKKPKKTEKENKMDKVELDKTEKEAVNKEIKKESSDKVEIIEESLANEEKQIQVEESVPLIEEKKEKEKKKKDKKTKKENVGVQTEVKKDVAVEAQSVKEEKVVKKETPTIQAPPKDIKGLTEKAEPKESTAVFDELGGEFYI